MPHEEALEGAEAKGETLPGQLMTHLLDGGIPGGTQGCQNGIMVRFDAAGAAVTTQGLRARLTFFPFPLPPAADARRADPEALACFAMRCASLHGGDDTCPEIERQRLRHAYRPPIRQTV